MYFGVVIIFNITIGLTIPPHGLLLFVLAAITRIPLREIYRRAWAESAFPADRRRPALEAFGWKQLKAYLDSGGLTPRPHVVEHAFTAGVDGWRLRADARPAARWRLEAPRLAALRRG